MTLSRADGGLHNIPTELTTFVGREREITHVSRFLARTRFLTLIGAGGAGKSRLAFRAAARALAEFPDGVWAVELASLAEPALVPQRVAVVLKVPEQSARDVAATLADALRGKSVLLVLDNCEHVAAATAALAGVLLRECPDLRVLATSRIPLSVPGETLWRVPSLTLPASSDVASPREAAHSEAVRLFVERARAVDPAFALEPVNAADVVQICRRLDGVPLAIELAAARAGVLSPAQIAARLDDRFRLLTGGTTGALPRHQTLRATMEWSYGLLGARERTVLRRLAVFAGGWTLEAAESICGEDILPGDVLDSVGRLVDGSLVIASTREGEARYRLLETVLQYGRERLAESGEEAQVCRRHLEWYVPFAEQCDRGLRGADEALWMGRLEREHDNLLAALDYAKLCDDGGAAEARLARALEWFWHVAGYWTGGRARLDGVLARGVEDQALLPKVYVGAVRLAYRMGDRCRARSLCDEGLALSRRVGDRLGEGCCLIWLGILAMEDENPDRARPLLEGSLDIFRELGNRWWTVEALSFLGALAVMSGAYDEARRLHEASLAVARETGNLNNVTTALRNLAHLALRRGDDQQAAAYYSESLLRCRTTAVVTVVVDSRPVTGSGPRGGAPSQPVLQPGVITECLDGLARVACERRAYEPAARLFGATEACLERLGGGLPLWSDKAEHDRYLAVAQSAMGDGAFAAARESGRTMTLHQAIDFALSAAAGTTSAVRGDAPGREAAAGPLTAREREVAALVAQGLTNREIAAALVVTERTAETHVQNILNKLGFSTRAHVAAWAVEQGLKQPRSRPR
ncbi:MAG TPA: LuxR C-terminal-related transcriptional regulator [bacterium]|nr:LuxR C-terminal-related transcriptional regulator [bacterium]